MPIYEYVCMSCESHFEELVRHDETPKCPDCGTTKVQQSALGVRGLQGQAGHAVKTGGGRASAAAAGQEAVAATESLHRRELTPRAPIRRRGRGLHALRPREGPHAGRLRLGLADGRPDVRRRGARASTRTSRASRSSAPPGSCSGSCSTASGMQREDVYIANVLKCRPPGNRDPQPEEIEACEAHLFKQIELIRPKVVATLGNFSTKLLSGKPRRDHARARRRAAGDARRLDGAALSALPPGRRALHAADARGARDRLRPAARAARPHAAAPRRAGRSSRPSRAAPAAAGRAGSARPLLSRSLAD